MRFMPEDWAQQLTVPVDDPVFLVEVWVREGSPPSSGAWCCEETALAECDVHEAIAWARHRTPEGAHYTLRACYFDPQGNGIMVWLAGEDPLRDPDEEPLVLTWS